VSGNHQIEALLAMVKEMPSSDLPRFIGDLEEVRATAQMRLVGPLSEQTIHRNSAPVDFFSVDDIAARWRCSRGTVYNRLRSAGAMCLDFSSKKQSRSKRSISRATVFQIEEKFSKRVS
jgi:hypothetical protein